MRTLPHALTARIESGAAMLCHAWIVRRADGTVMGFTDHDRDLTVEGVVCRAASGWTAGVAETGGGAVGTMAASGGLDDDAITEGDVAAGVYDSARVELWRVDWTEPELRVRLWAGRLARMRREGKAFVAEIEGRWRRWSGWSGGPMGAPATRCWGMVDAGSRRSRARSVTSVGRPVSRCSTMGPTSRAFRGYRATTS